MIEPTMAATHVERSKKPSMESTPKITFPSQPPRRPPAIPISMVMMMPPGSLPGISALAMRPASSPMKIQAMMPMMRLLPRRTASYARTVNASSLPLRHFQTPRAPLLHFSSPGRVARRACNGATQPCADGCAPEKRLRRAEAGLTGGVVLRAGRRAPGVRAVPSLKRSAGSELSPLASAAYRLLPCTLRDGYVQRACEPDHSFVEALQVAQYAERHGAGRRGPGPVVAQRGGDTGSRSDLAPDVLVADMGREYLDVVRDALPGPVQTGIGCDGPAVRHELGGRRERARVVRTRLQQGHQIAHGLPPAAQRGDRVGQRVRR